MSPSLNLLSPDLLSTVSWGVTIGDAEIAVSPEHLGAKGGLKFAHSQQYVPCIYSFDICTILL